MELLRDEFSRYKTNNLWLTQKNSQQRYECRRNEYIWDSILHEIQHQTTQHCYENVMDVDNE